MTDAEMMADLLDRYRAHLSTLEAMVIAEHKHPGLYQAEQAAYRRLDLVRLQHYAQQRFITLPNPPKEK